jgi:hypothetical protein
MGTRTYSRRRSDGTRVPTALGIRTGKFTGGVARVAQDSVPMTDEERVAQSFRDGEGYDQIERLSDAVTKMIRQFDDDDTVEENDTGYRSQSSQSIFRDYVDAILSAQRSDGSWDVGELESLARSRASDFGGEYGYSRFSTTYVAGAIEDANNDIDSILRTVRDRVASTPAVPTQAQIDAKKADFAVVERRMEGANRRLAALDKQLQEISRAVINANRDEDSYRAKYLGGVITPSRDEFDRQQLRLIARTRELTKQQTKLRQSRARVNTGYKRIAAQYQRAFDELEQMIGATEA